MSSTECRRPLGTRPVAATCMNIPPDAVWSPPVREGSRCSAGHPRVARVLGRSPGRRRLFPGRRAGGLLARAAGTSCTTGCTAMTCSTAKPAPQTSAPARSAGRLEYLMCRYAPRSDVSLAPRTATRLRRPSARPIRSISSWETRQGWRTASGARVRGTFVQPAGDRWRRSPPVSPATSLGGRRARSATVRPRRRRGLPTEPMDRRRGVP